MFLFMIQHIFDDFPLTVLNICRNVPIHDSAHKDFRLWRKLREGRDKFALP